MRPQQNKLKVAIKQLIGLSIVSTQVSLAGDIFTVTNDSDTPSMGEVTLREAINLANATSGAIIDFDPVFFAEPKTIELTQGELLIQSSVTLQGPGADLITVDAMGYSRTLTISNEDNSLLDVAINDITLTGGDGSSTINDERGGCLLSFENLTITDSVVTGCSSGTDGGGIWHRFGTFNMTATTVHDNTAPFKGGGVYLRDSVNIIINSTISENSVNFNGGGIYVNGGVDLRFSTITNNISYNNRNAGLYVRNNSTNLNKVIVSGNFGNSDVASNNNTFTVYDSVLGTIGVETTLIASNSLTDTDPQLNAIAFNGGNTPTHLPLFTSPAIDIGNAQCLGVITDQRGSLRNDGMCDAGAVEFSINDDVIFKDNFEPIQTGMLNQME